MNVLEMANIMTTVLAEPAVRDVFKTVASLRRVKLKELVSDEKRRPEIKTILSRLRDAQLVAEERFAIEDWNQYYVTAQGLEVERALTGM